MEADLQREYQTDLCDFWRGTLTARKLWVLIEGLSPECRTAYALAGIEDDDRPPWSLTNTLLGRNLEELERFRWQIEGLFHDPREGPRREAPEHVLPRRSATDPAVPDDAAGGIPVIRPGQLGGFL